MYIILLYVYLIFNNAVTGKALFDWFLGLLYPLWTMSAAFRVSNAPKLWPITVMLIFSSLYCSINSLTVPRIWKCLFHVHLYNVVKIYNTNVMMYYFLLLVKLLEIMNSSINLAILNFPYRYYSFDSQHYTGSVIQKFVGKILSE